MKRISARQLERLDHQLADRDKAIFASLQKCRYLTTGQIRRLHFNDHASKNAALRAANRMLSKLQEFGLIVALSRRVGGRPGGSGAYVWSLTEAGARLLHLNDIGGQPRKRFFEPSPAFVEHTLAVSEAYLQISEICAAHKPELVAADLEPACWRGYVDEDGKSTTLKPDLYAVTADGEYEDCWFVEIDLATESPCVVLEKCKRYAYYYKTGAEQKKNGVFPLVVWIVPGAARKESLRRNISECRELSAKNIFLVITSDELEGLIKKGGP